MLDVDLEGCKGMYALIVRLGEGEGWGQGERGGRGLGGVRRLLRMTAIGGEG